MYTYKIKNKKSPTDIKDAVKKGFCDSKLLLSASNKILIKDELINEFITSENEDTSTVNFCKKVASDTIS